MLAQAWGVKRGLKSLWLALIFAMTLGAIGPIGAQPAEPIVLGFMGVMSGPNALNGELTSRGAILAVEQINVAGGVNVGGVRRQVRLVIEDDRAQPPAAVNATNKLIQQDHAFAILGSDFSNNVLATMPITKRNGVLHIYSGLSSATTAPDVRSDMAFRNRAQDNFWARAVADYVVRQLGRNHRVGISYLTIEYGQTGSQAVEAELKKAGVPVVEKVTHNLGDQDLTANAASLIRANADVVVAWTVQAPGVLLLRQLKSLGWNGKYIYSTPDPFFTGIGGALVNGVVGPQNWAFTDTRPKSSAFTTAYVARFGQFPSSHSAGYYDAVNLIKDGIERTGLNALAVRDYITGLKTWEGVQGTFRPSRLSKEGNLIAVVVMVEIREGQPLILKRYDYAAGE